MARKPTFSSPRLNTRSYRKHQFKGCICILSALAIICILKIHTKTDSAGDFWRQTDISLCIPALPQDFYEGWLLKTLDSVVHQSFSPKEIIISLSNISASEARVLKNELRRKTSPMTLHVVSTEALLTPGESRNRAFEKSSGMLISFFDADDVMHPRRIEILSQCFFQVPSLQIVIHGLIYHGNWNENMQYKNTRKLWNAELCEIEQRTREQHCWLNSPNNGLNYEIAHGHITVHRSLLHDHKFTNKSTGEDCAFIRDTLMSICTEHTRTHLSLLLDEGLTKYFPRSSREYKKPRSLAR